MMKVDEPQLAADLTRALDARGMTLDDLAVRTKVPRSTLRALFGHEDLVVLPGRVYLRAHLRLVIDELAMNVETTLSAFDRAFPTEVDLVPLAKLPRVSPGAVAIAAGLTGIGLLAIVLSIVSG